ncbi:MAG: 5-(carboxyamino)imidazole ribonucleotide synthase [Thermodesulfovibrionales bacterium]|nr:5-(carboxyamino)imidazole ribonucleotide synthase [Thermodesulfovibrionales bacterium]
MLFGPDSTIGIVGGGQLGRMLIMECRRMGYKSAVLDTDKHCPAAQIADFSYNYSELSDFINACNLTTYEFEHIKIEVLQEIEKRIPLMPSSEVLKIKQTRASEKSYLRKNGFPTPNFEIFKDLTNVELFIKEKKVVVKKTKGGYDGKGLYIISSPKEFEVIKDKIINEEFIIEDFVPYLKELSVICARNSKDNITLYPVVENVHHNGILLYSIAPADVSEKVKKRAYKIATDLIKSLKIIGLLCVEMFLMTNDELLINEFAPRPHNSGHYTIDACDISQFEMLLRAICGYEIIQPQCLCHSAMLNIIGKGTQDLDFQKLLSIPGVQIHFYGKKEVRKGRKMGHINIVGKDRKAVLERLNETKKIVYPNL